MLKYSFCKAAYNFGYDVPINWRLFCVIHGVQKKRSFHSREGISFLFQGDGLFFLGCNFAEYIDYNHDQNHADKNSQHTLSHQLKRSKENGHRFF